MKPAVDSQPKSAAAPLTEGQYTWRGILRVALEHKRELLIGQTIALLAVFAHVPIPLLMPLLVDEVLLKHPGKVVAFIDSLFPPGWHGPLLYILFMLMATIVLRIGSILLDVLQTRQFTLIGKDVTFRMRRDLLGRLQRVSMAEYETLGSGAVASHFVTDINAIDQFIGLSISKTLISALSLVGISIVLMWLHWQLALFILFLNPVVIYFTVTLGKRVKKLKQRENSAFELFQQALVETLDAIQQVRASNRERHYIKDVIDKARGIQTHSAAFSWKSDAAARLSFGIFTVGFEVFRASGMLMVVFSNLTVGEMMAVFGYLWFMMSPVQEVLNVQYAYYAANAALGRVNRLLELKREPEYPHLHDPFAGKPTVGIRMEHISFAYGGNEPVLKDVNLEIKAGEKIALVGASGGGKSTLVNVLLGLYPPSSGRLYFDDIPVTEIGLDVVREHVATVLQQPAMFNASVRANLTLGRDYSDEEMWQALQVAQLREVIEEMPQGLDAIIGRHGVRLSGGQLQRLAVARMILSDPEVVILDEATSALDTDTEARLHQALSLFLQGRTTIIIAHRLSAVRQADRVYVFEDGHIIEQGTHEELMEMAGLYHRLYGHLQG
jgi:ATP-binding cassette subfamily C protein